MNAINKKNLRKLAWQKGFAGVSGVAKAIGKSRVTVHRAVNNPHRYGPTIRAMEKILL